MAVEQLWIRGENGMLHVFDVPLPPGVQHRLDRGDLTRVTPDGQPWEAAAELAPPLGDLPPDAPALPKQTENRAVWTEFAVSQGIGRAEAVGMTKAELISTLTGSDE